MLLYFSPSMCSINSEQCFYLKYSLNANFSLSPLKLFGASEGNNENSHCLFPLVLSGSSSRLPGCIDKISIGKGGRKDCY